MCDKLNITLVQPDVFWHDTDKNLDHLSDLLIPVKQSDVIVLTEMFNTGFTMHPQEVFMPKNGGKVVGWMKDQAKKYNSAIMGSVVCEDGGKYFNRLFFVSPEGDTFKYDKRHLFRMADEHDHFTGGKERVIINYKGWKLCPLVCYDLRFPVWSRNKYQDETYEYDLLLYVANWPKVRSNAWITLLEARAIENLSYCLGVNRVGADANNIDYSGDSRLFDFKGYRLDEIESSKEQVKTITIDKKALDAFRKKFPTGLDADKFEVQI